MSMVLTAKEAYKVYKTSSGDAPARIVVTHAPEIAQKADRVIRIEAGF